MDTADTFTLALVQMACAEEPRKNLEHASRRIREAAKGGAHVVCLPELFLSRYFCQREDLRFFDLAEPIPGPTTDAMAALARATGAVLVVPLFEKRGPGLYHNSLVVIDGDGSIAGHYRKMHIPDDPCYYEKYYFTPGDLGFKAWKTRHGCIGTLICWDQWYPEAARLVALAGAEVICYPTAIGWHPAEKAAEGPRQLDAWRTVQRGHAVANGVYVAAANRVGHERDKPEDAGIEFWGNSFVCDPQGACIAEAPADKEEILYAVVDRRRIEYVRRNWPFLRDRRIDAYADIAKRYRDA